MKLIDRGLAAGVVEAMSDARVVALLGPRQAGKSTLARMLAAERLPADYLTLDDAPTRALAAGDPAGFVSGLGRRTIIDEIQRTPELLLAIKSRVDRDGAPGQFLLTGSANLRRIPTVADALPGRADYLTLWPLTQGEVEGRPEDFLGRLFDREIPAIRDAPVGRREYAERLLAGGFPEARARGAAARRRFFESYVTSIVERDVADTSRVLDPTPVGTLLRLVAARSGSLARYDALAREVGIDGKTAKAHLGVLERPHLGVLERLFLVRVRAPWHVNLGQRQVKAPKLSSPTRDCWRRWWTPTSACARGCGLRGRTHGDVRRDRARAPRLVAPRAVELLALPRWGPRGRCHRGASLGRDHRGQGEGERNRPPAGLPRPAASTRAHRRATAKRRGALYRRAHAAVRGEPLGAAAAGVVERVRITSTATWEAGAWLAAHIMAAGALDISTPPCDALAQEGSSPS
ncbi:MAG TPA: AAA family ATPase [Solirubrobacteraceae bacterium]